jgi:hypothetical protein
MNISNLLEKIESYKFECEGGPLNNCIDWIELKTKIVNDGFNNDDYRIAKKWIESMALDVKITYKGN